MPLMIQGMIENIEYFGRRNWQGLMVAAFTLLVLTAIVGTIIEGIYEHEEFMGQCMVDYKEYECTLMWRDSRQDTAIAPLVIHGYQP